MGCFDAQQRKHPGSLFACRELFAVSSAVDGISHVLGRVLHPVLRIGAACCVHAQVVSLLEPRAEPAMWHGREQRNLLRWTLYGKTGC